MVAAAGGEGGRRGEDQAISTGALLFPLPRRFLRPTWKQSRLFCTTSARLPFCVDRCSSALIISFTSPLGFLPAMVAAVAVRPGGLKGGSCAIG